MIEDKKQFFIDLASKKKERLIEQEKLRKELIEIERLEKELKRKQLEELLEEPPQKYKRITKGKMLKGLFVNGKQAICSLYESGVMIKNALKSDKYQLDYLEISRDQALKNYNLRGNYDFYVINWHHITLPVKPNYIRTLPGLKIGVILESNPGEPFAAVPENIFDTWMVIDPTERKTNKVFPFPRPLEKAENLLPLLREDIPVIGSFGLFTPGKCFDRIIKAWANKDKKVMIRINIPFATYTLISEQETRNHADYLKSLATPNIELEITHNYYSKQELISWCSQNTANAFLYDRVEAGLAAASDQNISAGRGLVVSGNRAFRHIHPYTGFYPEKSFEELMITSLPGVRKMQEDWTPENFNLTFESLLKEKGLL